MKNMNVIFDSIFEDLKKSIIILESSKIGINKKM